MILRHSHGKKTNFIFLFIFLSCFLLSSCHFLKKSKSTILSSPLKEVIIPEGVVDLEHRFSSEKLKNKIIFINFWASWCGPCQEEMPSLLKLVSEQSKDVILISLNVDNSEKEMKKFMGLFPNFKGENIYIFYDGSRKWVQSYGVTGFPETFIYDRNQKFLKRHQGAIDFKGEEFSQFVKRIIIKSDN